MSSKLKWLLHQQEEEQKLEQSTLQLNAMKNIVIDIASQQISRIGELQNEEDNLAKQRDSMIEKSSSTSSIIDSDNSSVSLAVCY